MTQAAVAVLMLLCPPFGQSASRPVEVEPSAQRPMSAMVEAELRTDRVSFSVNSPITVEFLLRNKTGDYVRLEAPLGDLAGRLPPGAPLMGMGLPLEHVFSGANFRGLSIAIEGDPYVGDRIIMPPGRTVPPIVLAPYGEIGVRFDVTRNYPALRQSGRYELRWLPYRGQIESRPILIDVRPFKQVTMNTDAGPLTFRLLYDKAPRTVDNFLALVDSRFYDGLSFFAVDPALAIQGGCPKRDGTGRAPDGRTIPPEFNDSPFDFGTVGMSLSRISASQTDPNSASCQFFVTLSRVTALDGRYTAFAQIEGPDSRETLRKIAAGPRGPNGYPVKPVVIRNATSMDAPLPPTP